ncbi:MAG: c-type cytochrome [Burkholderiaceae bacterium]
MGFKKAILRSCLGILVGLSATSIAVADVKGSAEAGAKKNSMCIGCHGIPDYKTAYPVLYRVPKIAGQNYEYLVASLNAYRAGERNHPSMVAIAKTLTDQDIADLASFYAEGGR